MATNTFINIPDSGSASWQDPVATASALPLSNNSLGDVRVVLDTETIYVWNGSSWDAVATPGAAIALDGLIGDVSASGPGVAPATVNSVGGVSAASVASGATAANNATSSNTPNTIVLRDGSGNFSAGTITATLNGNASNVSGTITPAHGGTGLTATPTNGQLPIGNGSGYTLATLTGTANQVNVTNGSGSIILALPQSIAITSSPTFASLTLTTPLSIANGGTGSSTQNFVDLTTNQLVAGNKTFSGQTSITNTSATALTVNSTTLVVDALNGAVGINTTPATISVLDIVNNSGTTKAIQATGFGSNIGFRGRRANGTLISPTQTLNGDVLTFFSGRGYGSTSFIAASTGAMNITAAENFTDTTAATYLGFNSTPTGSVTSVERMRISPPGNLLIGTTTDNGNNKLQVNGSFLAGTSTLTDAANIATNASLANRFTVTLGGNRNLSAPTNPTDGQKVIWEFKQDATGNRTLTYDAIFDFGNMPSLILSSAANKIDYMGAIYNSSITKWSVVAYSSAY